MPRESAIANGEKLKRVSGMICAVRWRADRGQTGQCLADTGTWTLAGSDGIELFVGMPHRLFQATVLRQVLAEL